LKCKKLKFLGLFCIILLFMFLLAGCGGDSSGSSAPKLETTTVSGTVNVPYGTDTNKEVVSIDLLKRIANLFNGKVMAVSLYTPLANAEVTAVNFNTNQQVGTVTPTDNTGGYTISGIPKGITVMIVVEKEVGDKRVHLATLIPDVGNTQQLDGREPGVVDAATTITALRYSEQRGNSDFKIAPTDVENTLKEAKNTVDTILKDPKNEGMDLTVGSGCIEVGSDGKPKLDIDNTELADFENKTAVPDPEYYPAKVMIQDVRNAGIFLGNTLNEQITKQQQTATEIANFFSTAGMEFAEIDDLITSSFLEGIPGTTNNPEEYTLEEILNLTSTDPRAFDGNNLSKAILDSEYWEWQINDISTGNSAYIKLQNIMQPGDSYTNYDVLIDLTNATFEYNVNETTDPYYFQGSLTLNNTGETLTKDITDDYGNIIRLIIPYDPNYSLDGTFHGPESGDVAMNLTLAGDANSSLTGTNNLNFSGSLNTQKIDANGDLSINATGDQDISEVTPDTVELTFAGNVSTATAEYHGDFDIDCIKNTNIVDIVPKSISFNGNYNDLGPQTTTWSGSLVVTIDNAADYDDLSESYFAYGNVNFNGEVTHVDHPTLSLDLNAGVNKTVTGIVAEGDGYLEITYGHGENTLDGTMEVTDTDVGQNMTLNLTNQNNIQFILNEEYNDNTYTSTITGSIKDANGNEIATIDDNEQGVPTVHYNDDTMETLF
jgi:hypothetical protein